MYASNSQIFRIDSNSLKFSSFFFFCLTRVKILCTGIESTHFLKLKIHFSKMKCLIKAFNILNIELHKVCSYRLTSSLHPIYQRTLVCWTRVVKLRHSSKTKSSSMLLQLNNSNSSWWSKSATQSVDDRWLVEFNFACVYVLFS